MGERWGRSDGGGSIASFRRTRTLGVFYFVAGRLARAFRARGSSFAPGGRDRGTPRLVACWGEGGGGGLARRAGTHRVEGLHRGVLARAVLEHALAELRPATARRGSQGGGGSDPAPRRIDRVPFGAEGSGSARSRAAGEDARDARRGVRARRAPPRRGAARGLGAHRARLLGPGGHRRACA